MRALLLLFLFGLLAAAVAAAEDRFTDFADALRSREPEKRRAALAEYLADTGLVPVDRADRARRLLLDVLNGDREPALRGLAARALAARRTTEGDLSIAARLVEESDRRAQRPMVEALAGSTDPVVVEWLKKRFLREPRADIRALLIEALGRTGDPEAGEYVRRAVRLELPWPVLAAAALALGEWRTPESVERLIDLLWSEHPAVRAAAHESLMKTTGRTDLPDEPAAWAKWWGEVGKDFAFPGPERPPDGRVATGVYERGFAPTYYGVPIRGRRVIFCLDVSASMWGPKIEAAKEELARAVLALPSSYEFTVLFFNQHPFPWRDWLEPAFPYQKLALTLEFAELDTKMYTNVFDTLEMALGFAGLGRFAKEEPPGVDDVFLVTDGQPNRGRHRTAETIVAALAEIDPHHRVRIHTIAVGDEPRDLLKAIAEARGGAAIHVPAAR